MARGKKQFALIWWVGTDQSNVIPLSKIKKKDQEIDCVTELMWVEGKEKRLLKAKIVAIGDDEKVLYNIPLNSQGMINDSSNKIFSSEVISCQKDMCNSKKLVEDIRKSNQRRLDNQIVADPPIFPINNTGLKRKQRGNHLDGRMSATATGATLPLQEGKSKVRDTVRLKRSHSIAMGSGVTGSMAQPGSQKEKSQSTERSNSSICLSGSNYDSHMDHHLPNPDVNDNQMRINSLNYGGERRDSYSTAMYPITPNSHTNPSPRTPFFPNYNPMGNQNDANYWYQQNPRGSQQNNFPMWSRHPNSVMPSTSFYPPEHQQHHPRPNYFSTGSENYHPQSAGFYDGIYPPLQPPEPNGMNLFLEEQYSWNSKPTGPQKTAVDGNTLNNEHQLRQESEGIISQEVPSIPTDSTKSPVLTLLTTVKNTQSNGNQNSVGTSSILSASTTPVEIQSFSSVSVDNQGVSAGMCPNYVPIDLVRQKVPSDISSDDQRRDEMGHIGQYQGEENSKSEDDDNNGDWPKRSSESFRSSPDDWRQRSDDEYSYNEAADTGDQDASAGNADDGADDEITNAGADSNDAHINLMARAIAPYLPRPAPQGFIDYQRAVLLALELNNKEIQGSKLKINVPRSKPSSELPEKPLAEHYYKSGEDKEEIAQYSGFYMHRDNLSLAHLMAMKTGKFLWKTYVKAILDIVYDNDIANYCAQGKRNTGRPGICPRLLNGLYSKICFIVQQSGDVVSYSDYTYVINKKGSNKRPK